MEQREHDGVYTVSDNWNRENMMRCTLCLAKFSVKCYRSERSTMERRIIVCRWIR